MGAQTADTSLPAGLYRGPLHGIPLALKDNLTMADGETTVQSRVLDAHSPKLRFDGEAVYRLRRAGAIIVGKTTLGEFARGAPREAEDGFRIPKNPWDSLHGAEP